MFSSGSLRDHTNLLIIELIAQGDYILRAVRAGALLVRWGIGGLGIHAVNHYLLNLLSICPFGEGY